MTLPGIARHERLPVHGPVRPPKMFKPNDAQILAMLRWRGGELSHALLDRLNAAGVRWPSSAELIELDREGFSTFVRGKRTLSPMGSTVLRALAIDLAKRLDLHITWTQRAVTKGPSIHCSCGWSAHYRKGFGADLALNRFATQHLRRVGAMNDGGSGREGGPPPPEAPAGVAVTLICSGGPHA